MKLPELKPCPFCGSEPHIRMDNVREGYISILIGCDLCEVAMESDTVEIFEYDGFYEMKDAAQAVIECWNERYAENDNHN